jgi:hypothetical protein
MTKYHQCRQPSFKTAVKRFLGDGREKPRRGAAIVAGPVINGRRKS